MKKIKTILQKTNSCSAAIIGDFTLDFYIMTAPSCSSVSIETGLPTLPVSSFRTAPGGAGNVALNMKALQLKNVYALGVLGEDMFGQELLKCLKEHGIDTSGMVRQKNEWITPVYTKVMENRKEGKRIDFGNFNRVSRKSIEKLMNNLASVADRTDVIVINQQLVSGIHTQELQHRLTDFIKARPKPVFITDSRNYPEVYKGSLRKINSTEGREVLRRNGQPVPSGLHKDRELACKLFDLWKQPVFLTRAEKGILVCDNSGISEIPGIHLTGELDTVGAGDSALAGIASALGAGFSPSEAATLGNLAASVTVQKQQTTGTASPREILSLEKEAVYLFNPELAVNGAEAFHYNNSEIEIILRPSQNQHFQFAMFDHDGTISTLRQGWEEVMEPMMVESITDNKDIPPSLQDTILQNVRSFISRTTGMQTLIQMKGLVEMVRRFGLVPEEKILDEHQYKRIYNERLMAIVSRRTEKYIRGELNIQDVTVKNAFNFLEELHKRGIKLYLASGTDQEDVCREAELLGYSRLFTGGIFGSTGDITHEPKKVAIQEIISSIGPSSASRIIAFGDGPVEIAETKRSGGYTVGVASNEIKRYGLNPGKRTRLIRAGADLIIPDYSQFKELLSLLEGKKTC